MAALESDLSASAARSSAEDALRAEWDTARQARRTSATYESWRAECVSQAAAGWLLETLFLRIAEDNDLLPGFYLDDVGDSGPDWIREGLRELRVAQYVPEAADPARGPMNLLALSADAAQSLAGFWWARTADGSLVYDFTDPELDTGFLAEIYQGLSEKQRAKYALLGTPGFVTDFILKRTLQPAIQEFGLEDLRIIDPVCGSGTFLIAAFQLVLAEWGRMTGHSTPELVGRALRSVYGIDKNPIAAAIARFRLSIEADKALGSSWFSGESPSLRPNVKIGDSLLEDPFHQSYHVVVGNPPYITPKDKAESALYRERYPDCVGLYALTIPFMERFFELGIRSPGPVGAGYVGMLVSNSFMKREFGRSIVEKFFPTVNLTDVIDTSGVYIPGHGMPTAILLGRSSGPQGDFIKAVVGLHGEPRVPEDPARGVVWRSILKGAVDIQWHDDWAQGVLVERKELREFPWSFNDKSTTEMIRAMEVGGNRLGGRGARIGYFASTGADEIFTASTASFHRMGVESGPLVKAITGSEVRDWQVSSEAEAAMFAPADKGSLSDRFPRHFRRLWPYRTTLEQRRNYSGHSYFEDGRLWYGWHHITEVPDAHPWSVVFSWVSTHNHFAVLRDRAAPLNSAPVIRLPRTASGADVIQLAALLNSSLACFWLKHYSNSKGQPGVGQTGTGEPWTVFYEFTGTRLADFPLPPDRWTEDRWSLHAEHLDSLVQSLDEVAPGTVLKRGSAARPAELNDARVRWEKARASLVGRQEELDWEIYLRYGLIDKADDFLAPVDAVPELIPGERAFEIVLARRIDRGEADTTWFERNGIQPVTEIPSRWPASYKEIVENRIRVIEHDPHIWLVERPEFKRRWASPSWELQEKGAIRNWLLDRCEDRRLWYDPDSGRPRPLTARELARQLSSEQDFIEMARRYAGEAAEPVDVVADLTQAEHVPYLAALRYSESGLPKHDAWTETWHLQRELAKNSRHAEILPPPRYSSMDFLKPAYWRLRGKFDVPNERFISYPSTSPDEEQLLGWAGWSHAERARVLADIIETRKNSGGGDAERLRPLLAGLRELLFWLELWHPSPEPPLWDGEPGSDVRRFLAREQQALELSDADLDGWRPPKPRRGRPRKNLPRLPR